MKVIILGDSAVCDCGAVVHADQPLHLRPEASVTESWERGDDAFRSAPGDPAGKSMDLAIQHTLDLDDDLTRREQALEPRKPGRPRR